MTINTSGALYGTTVHSNLTLTVASRTTSGVKFNYTITSYLNASGYVSGETYSGKITISGSNITTKVTNITIKPYADYWSGTTQHTITGTIEVSTSSYADLTANVLYEVTTSASSDKNSGTGTINTTSGQPPLSASSVSASASVTAGNNLSVTVTPATNFYSVRHHIDIYIGSNKVAQTDITASTTAKTVSINIPTSAANLITTAMSATATVTCTTYSGSTNAGAKSTTTTINVPAYTLNGSITATPVSSTQFTGKNLQNVTKLSVAISGVSNYGAGLSYSATIDGIAYKTATFTTAAIKQSGNVTVSATITDSRGKTKTVTSSAITFVAYAPPTITSLSAGRNATTPSNVNITVQGVYYPLSGSNTLSSHTELAGATNIRTTTTASYSLTFTMTANELQTYTGTIYVDDTVGNKSATYAFTISTKAVQIDLHHSGKGVAMGKVAETEGIFDCAYAAHFGNGIQLGSHPFDVVDNLTSADAYKALSANQGRILKSLIPTAPADYIVEQGTSGIWTYRKWNSGIAECWGLTTRTEATTTKAGNVYQGTANSAAYPSGLFIAEPYCMTSISNANQAYLTWLTYGRNGSSTQTVVWYVASPVSRASVSVSVAIHSVGRWK